MIKNKVGIEILLVAMLLAGIVLVPATSAQEETDYSVTVEEAFEHANANMIDFVATDTPGFENWIGASIDSNPLELYDIDGKKLFYQFSVYKAKKLIGTIDVCADKTMGHSINDIRLDPEPYKVAEAKKKSKELAKKNYPAGKVKSTKMVVYSYPRVGAMTIVLDKATGKEYRIFVDAYTLEEVQDKPTTETYVGVWSMYDMALENGVEENLEEWKKSDQFIESLEQTAVNKGVDINTTVTEESMNKLSVNAAVTAITSNSVSVPVKKQETNYYCVPTSIQMLCMYYKKPSTTPSQTYIFKYFGGKAPTGLPSYDIIQWVGKIWGKTPIDRTSALNNIDVVTEIDNKRPFFSLIKGHCRVCRGYKNQGGYFYLYINDPMPGKAVYEKTYSGPEIERIYVR